MARLPQAVLLAAGASRRFGSPKQLASVHGEPLVRRVARIALQLPVAGVTVVVGARGSEVAEALRGLPVRVLHNARWREGMASSIRRALGALPRGTPGLLLLLADQAWVGARDLRPLLARWRAQPDAAVAARYGRALGAPCVLPGRSFAALSRLRGDVGARGWLRSPRTRAIGLALPAAAFDVDRPSDLAATGRAGV